MLLIVFPRFVQRCPEGIEPLGREEFRLICGVSRRSAPGPDGIGYMAWRAGGETAADIVYDCYKQILDGGEVPSWFHRSTLVFIPKGDPGAGGVGVQARPGDLRPLSLSNADQKLVALAINLSLSRVCEETAHSAQRGFRRGKSITDNVLELEARIVKKLYTGARCPALLLIDIIASFPSVAWDWLWYVLELMDCPVWLIRAVKAPYIDSTAQLAAGGLRGVTIGITSGITQGCPMSGSLWCLVFDPIIRALVELVGEDGSLSAFADDIGVSVGDIIRALLVLVPILGPIGAATCLKLNWKKTHIVNFFKLSIFKLKKQIEEAVPQALGAEICYVARYLGFLVGPCAKDHAWEAPCRKLLERARHIKTLGLSLNEAVLAVCVFAFSVIRFSLQLVPVSPVLVCNFGLALDICTSSPRYSLGVSVLCSLRRLGMPIEVPDLPSTSRATIYRTANASEVLDRLYEEVCATRDSDRAVFCPWHHP